MPRLGALPALLAILALGACSAPPSPPAPRYGHGCAGTPHEHSIHLPILYLFPLQSGELDPSYPSPNGHRRLSEEIVRTVRRYPAESILDIQGHNGVDCPEEMNHPEISLRRAQSVADELAGLGFPRSRMRVRGVGVSEPTTCCQGYGCRDGTIDYNRRVEISVRWCENAGAAPAR